MEHGVFVAAPNLEQDREIGSIGPNLKRRELRVLPRITFKYNLPGLKFYDFSRCYTILRKNFARLPGKTILTSALVFQKLPTF